MGGGSVSVPAERGIELLHVVNAYVRPGALFESGLAAVVDGCLGALRVREH